MTYIVPKLEIWLFQYIEGCIQTKLGCCHVNFLKISPTATANFPLSSPFLLYKMVNKEENWITYKWSIFYGCVKNLK